jgi:hypothetical protein
MMNIYSVPAPLVVGETPATVVIILIRNVEIV